MLPLGSKQGFRLVPAWLGAALQEESWGCWQRQAEHKPAACLCCRGSQMRSNGQTPETREPQGIRDKLEGVEQIAHRGCKASILTAFPLGSITPKSKAFTSLYSSSFLYSRNGHWDLLSIRMLTHDNGSLMNTSNLIFKNFITNGKTNTFCVSSNAISHILTDMKIYTTNILHI